MTRRFRQVFADRNIILPVIATILGVVLIAVGWVLQGADYVPGLMQQIGSALLLLMPLLYLGRLIEARVRRTEERTTDLVTGLADVRSEIGALSALSKTDLDLVGRRRQELIAEAYRTPGAENVAALLREAAAVGAVDAGGIRVPLGEGALRLRLAPAAPGAVALTLRVERADGHQVATTDWTPDVSPQVVGQAISRQLRAATGMRTQVDVQEALRRVVGLLRTALAARTGQTPVDLGHVIEIPNEHWVISAEGLRSLHRSYVIPRARLLDRSLDWPRHMADKEWVDTDSFTEAYQLALHLLVQP